MVIGTTCWRTKIKRPDVMGQSRKSIHEKVSLCVSCHSLSHWHLESSWNKEKSTFLFMDMRDNSLFYNFFNLKLIPYPQWNDIWAKVNLKNGILCSILSRFCFILIHTTAAKARLQDEKSGVKKETQSVDLRWLLRCLAIKRLKISDSRDPKVESRGVEAIEQVYRRREDWWRCENLIYLQHQFEVAFQNKIQ